MDTLFIGTEMTIALADMKWVGTGAIVSDNTVVECTLLDKTGAPVVGQIWPLNMTNYSEGVFAGTLQATLELSLNHTYTASVTATAPNGSILHMECDYQAVDRCVPC